MKANLKYSSYPHNQHTVHAGARWKGLWKGFHALTTGIIGVSEEIIQSVRIKTIQNKKKKSNLHKIFVIGHKKLKVCKNKTLCG